MTFTGWFGFWIFMSVFMVCDTWLYSRGHSTFFWEHRTKTEKEIQRKQVEEAK